MDPLPVQEQSTHPILSPAKVQKLETLGLYYNSPEQAIICMKCSFALSPRRASEHPGKKHGIARSARHGLKPLLSSLNLPDPDTLAPRQTSRITTSPVPCRTKRPVLAEHRDKLKLTAEKKSRQHCLRDHIQQEVLFQSWTANNTRRSWLVSSDNEVNNRSIPSSILLQASPDPIKLLARKLFTEEHVRLENQQSGGRRSRVQETPASSALQTNWLRRTGWETTFRKARCDVLVRLAALPHCTDNRPLPLGVVEGEAIISPARDERRLLFMVDALDRLLDQCDPAANKDGGHDGDEGEYEDQDGDEDEDEFPDDGEIQDDDEDEDDEGYNEIEDESQKRVVVDTSDPSDDDATSTWSSNSQEDHPQGHALDILLRFCYSAITEDYDGGVASSTMLVYFSAVRGLTTPEGDEYLKPHRFTPTLAKLIYCSRLIFLEAVLPRFSRIYGGFAHPPRHGLLRRLNAARREYMCDGTLLPMGEFLSLLSYGNALRRSQGSSFRFYWSDDGEVLSWDGNQRLSMVDFRGLAREVLRSVTASCSRLMYDWEPPYIDLSLIRDNLSTTTPGYSFVSDPTNKLTGAYLELLLRACISPIDGLLCVQGKDHGTWNTKAVRAYLEAHDDHLKGLMSVSTPWTVSTFTKELRRHCSAAIGIPPGIGVQMYRQISIAITERHVHDAAIRFNRFDDTTGTAGPEVAYAWQSGHRPMQRHTTYGLDGAYPDHLQPALLRAYDRVSASWHAFLWRCDQSGEPGSIPVEAEHAELKYGSPRHDLTTYRKRPFTSDLEETLSNSKRPRSGLGLLLLDEVGVQPDSEETLALRAEEEVNSLT
ncbi:hypothetical protein FSPOR_11930, partial [Fusarium sporotrichioides]